MNSTTVDAVAIDAAPDRQARLPGLGNLVRKDVSDWFRSRRPGIVAVVSLLIFLPTAANARITEWAAASFPRDPGDGPAKVLSLVPLDNLMMAVATQFIVIAVVFATMNLLLGERDSGTLAWTVSKPVSRTSVLVSKWLTATIVLWATAVVIPLAATAALVSAIYGMPDLRVVGVLGLALAAVPALFVAVAIATSTFVTSQSAVGAIGLAVLATPLFLGGLVPSLAPFFPTSIFGWAIDVSVGSSSSLVTPVAWLAAMGALFLVARRRFRGMEL